MGYQPTVKEQYAEQHAKARIDFETATTDLRNATTRENFAEREVQNLRTLRMSVASKAHDALDAMAANAESLLAQASADWVAKLVLPNPPPPPASAATAYMLSDPSYVAALHTQINRVAADPHLSGVHDRTLESIDAELETRRAELSDAQAATRDANTNLSDASSALREYDMGRVRI